MNQLLFPILFLTAVSFPQLFADEASEESALPQVLIIGDSISLGYTPHVVKSLEGKAFVRHHKGNAQHTGTGLRKIDQWIGDTQWDVIHFNWGLWDLCYRSPESKEQGKRDKNNGKVTTSLKKYEANLDRLVTRLKQTNAVLIWAHTSVVPEDEAGRVVGDDEKYNEVASKIMKKHGVAINDLYTLTKAFSADQFTKPGDVHYTGEGYQEIAKQVAEQIRAVITEE